MRLALHSERNESHPQHVIPRFARNPPKIECNIIVAGDSERGTSEE
jgi:hypothetical protein